MALCDNLHSCDNMADERHENAGPAASNEIYTMWNVAVFPHGSHQIHSGSDLCCVIMLSITLGEHLVDCEEDMISGSKLFSVIPKTQFIL